VLIFLLVQHHRSFDQFHEKADRIALIVTEERSPALNDKSRVVPYPMGAALRREYAFLEKTAMISARRNTLVTIAQPDHAPAKFKEEETRAFVEPELFEMFDFPLLHGSLEAFRAPNTALLTASTARKYYGHTDVVGKTFKVNNFLDYQVVGVLKDLPPNTDIRYTLFTSWATLSADAQNAGMLNNWGGLNGGTQCYVLFREGHALQELESAFEQFREKYYDPEIRTWYYHPVALRGLHFHEDYGSGMTRSKVLTLALIGLFLLLTACINFVNMATAQSLARAREVGVRKTMGSTRSLLFWQFMGETALIVVLASAIGLFLAHLGLPSLNAMAQTAIAPAQLWDKTLWAFLGAALVLATFLAGSYPALVLSGFRPAAALKGSSDAKKAGGFSLRRALVATQFVIAQVLVIAAVVVTAQLDYARKADLGFRQSGIVTLPLPSDEDRSKPSTLKQRLRALSGVENVSLCMFPPVSQGNWITSFKFQGRSENEPWIVNFKYADADYVPTFDLQIVEGRNLQASDTLREYLVNEAVVQKLGLASNADIIGKKISMGRSAFPVVGVVRNFHNQSLHENIQPQVLGCDAGDYSTAALQLNLRDAKATLAEVQRIWNELFPNYYYEQTFLDQQIADFYDQEGRLLQMAQLFAGIAIFIGCLGLYGLAAFMINRKTKEIGIRKTLGASVLGVIWMFGREYVRLLLLAFVLAAPIGYWAMRHWLADYEYRIPLGWGIFAAALILTFLIALLTVSAQSLKAALANPVKSLRSE
jgi:predicted permease